MRFALISVLIFISLCNCTHKSTYHTSDTFKVRAIGIVDTLPWLSNTAKKEEDNYIFYPANETKLISFYKNYRLYRIHSIKNWDTLHFINDSAIENKTYKRDTSYYYYARQDTNSIVYRIDSLNDPNFKKLPVDSLYRWSSVYKEPNIDEEEVLAHAQKQSVSEKGNLVTEQYLITAGKNTGTLIYLYFSKDSFWNNIPYSISFSTDKKWGMKFLGLKLIIKEKPLAKDIFDRKAKIYSSVIREENPKDEKQLLEAFLRFEKFLN